MRKYILDLVLLVAVVALIAQFGGVVRETLLYLVFGWWWYAERVIPKVTVSRDGLSTGIVCLVLFTIGFHALLRGFYREIQQPGDRPDTGARRWSSRWTTSIIAIVLLMFVIGLAASALVHQAGWLMASPEPLMVSKPVVPGSSLWNLRLIGEAALGIETLPAVRADSRDLDTGLVWRQLQKRRYPRPGSILRDGCCIAGRRRSCRACGCPSTASSTRPGPGTIR